MAAMSRSNHKLSLSLLDHLHTEGAGYDVLRYISLPQLLGTEANTILYFMGKDLARSFDIKNIEDIYNISTALGWGRMELVRERKKSLTFTLMADAVFHRLKSPLTLDFRLEAGFLAESISMIKGIECECSEKVNRKIHQVQFKVILTE